MTARANAPAGRQREESDVATSPIGTGIGQPVHRREDFRLVTGRGRYSDDINVAGQAYAVLVRSPHAHARIRSITTAVGGRNAGRARRSDRAGLHGRRPQADPAYSVVAITPPKSARQHDGSPPFTAAHYPMVADKVRHVGEIVAMVVADSVLPRPRPQPKRRDRLRGAAGNQRHCRGSTAGRTARARIPGSNVCVDAEFGDAAATDAAFARAGHVVKFETWVQRVTGVPMEPRAAIANYDPATGRLPLHAGNGGAVRPRHDLATVLNVPARTSAW